MPETVYYLTEADRREVKSLLEWRRSLPKNFGRGRTLEDDHQAPETYIAFAPAGGIPARTGTTPGYAECELYQISNRDSDTPSLQQVTTKTVRVFNLSVTALDGEQYLPVSRDKYGSWLAGSAGGGRQESVFDLCGIANVDGLLTGIRVKRLAADGITTSCELASVCPECGESGTDLGTGTGTYAELVTFNVLVEDYNVATGGTPGTGTPLAGRTVSVADSPDGPQTTDATGELVFTGVPDDLGTTLVTLFGSGEAVQISLQPASGGGSIAYGYSSSCHVDSGSPVRVIFSVEADGDTGTGAVGTDTDTDVVVTVSGNLPSGRTVTLNGVYSTTTNGAGQAYFYTVPVSTTNSVTISDLGGGESASWTATWSGGSGGPGTGFTASPFTTVTGTTTTVDFITSAGGGA